MMILNINSSKVIHKTVFDNNQMANPINNSTDNNRFWVNNTSRDLETATIDKVSSSSSSSERLLGNWKMLLATNVESKVIMPINAPMVGLVVVGEGLK
jgi:hypothetical protein